jgi:hypothetical protein
MLHDYACVETATESGPRPRRGTRARARASRTRSHHPTARLVPWFKKQRIPRAPTVCVAPSFVRSPRSSSWTYHAYLCVHAYDHNAQTVPVTLKLRRFAVWPPMKRARTARVGHHSSFVACVIRLACATARAHAFVFGYTVAVYRRRRHGLHDFESFHAQPARLPRLRVCATARGVSSALLRA